MPLDIRDAFFDELYEIAQKDPKVMVLTADMGAQSLNKFSNLSEQYFNVGVAEQNMVSVAAGIALGGRKVFIYTIIPFATMRCFEQIKVDICQMNLPVTIIGVGPGLAYGGDGPTHHGTQDIAIMRTLSGITIFNPSDAVMTKTIARLAYEATTPVYVRLDKGVFPEVHSEYYYYSLGLAEISSGKDLTIISTGTMVHRAMDVAERLKVGLSVGVIDLYRIKPLNEVALLGIINSTERIVTLEEHSIIGGIGSAIAEMLVDNGIKVPLKRLALPDKNIFECDNRDGLLKTYGLDVEGIVKTIGGINENHNGYS